MFSLYNSFLSLKSKQFYLRANIVVPLIFFPIILLMNLKGFMMSDFLFAFVLAIFFVSSLTNQIWLKCLVAVYNFLSLTICILKTVS